MEITRIKTAYVVEITGTHYIVRCPFCDEKHHHGKALGLRVAHCTQPGRAYLLKMAKGKKPPNA